MTDDAGEREIREAITKAYKAFASAPNNLQVVESFEAGLCALLRVLQRELRGGESVPEGWRITTLRDGFDGEAGGTINCHLAGHFSAWIGPDNECLGRFPTLAEATAAIAIAREAGR